MLRMHSHEVQLKIRSSFIITTLSQCIEELVLNSIDAASSNINVFLDTSSLTIEVNDNGCGFSKEELQSAGVKYYTSKCSSIDDLETKLSHYGYRGEALSSIAQLSSELTISTSFHNQTYSKTISNFNKIHHPIKMNSVCTNYGHGSTVIVQGLFANFPVRLNSFIPSIEIDCIKSMLTTIALVHCSLSVMFCEKKSGFYMKIGKSKSFSSRISQLLNIDMKNHLSKQFKDLVVDAYFSKKEQFKKSLQYVYVNKRPIYQTEISSLMKDLFEGTCQCLLSGDSDHSKAFFPSYILLIRCPYSWYDIGLEPSKTVVQFSDWKLILSTIQEMFLARAKQESSRVDFSNKPKLQKPGSEDEFTFDVATDLVCVAGRTAKIKCGEKIASSKAANSSLDLETEVFPGGDKLSEDLQRRTKGSKPKDTKESDVYHGWLEKFDPKIGKFYLCSSTGITSYQKPFENRSTCAPDKEISLRYKCPAVSRSCSSARPIARMSNWKCNSDSSLPSDASRRLKYESPIVFGAKHNLKAYKDRRLPKRPCKLSKTCLQSLKVIGQISNEFIACLTGESSQTCTSLLLFDQHAVHERIRLESFVEGDNVTWCKLLSTHQLIQKDAFDDKEYRQIKSIKLQQPLQFNVSEDELRSLETYPNTFNTLGLQYEILKSVSTTDNLCVKNVPAIVNSRDIPTIKKLIQERTEVLQRGFAPGITIPPTLFDSLCSRACHGAIRFGDKLTWTQCSDLMKQLSTCKLPFQCAHGRPSVWPLFDLSSVAIEKRSNCNLANLKEKMQKAEFQKRKH